MAHIRKYQTKSGTTWQAIVKRKGQYTTGTFPSRRTAQEWIAKIEHEMLNQKYFPERVGHDHSLAEAIDRYIEGILPTKSKGSQIKQLQILKWWEGVLGDKLLSQLSPEHFEEQKYYLWQDKKFSEYTVNVYLATISHVITVCSSPAWNWMRHNPVRHVKKLREKRNRLPSVTQSQLNMLLFWCDNSKSKYLSLFVRLALATGGRKREILDLKWSQIDLEGRRITFKNTKNKERRSVPIDEVTAYILQAIMMKYLQTTIGTSSFQNIRMSLPIRRQKNLLMAYTRRSKEPEEEQCCLI